VLAVADGDGVTALAAAGSRVPTDSPETRKPPATRPTTTVRPYPKYMRIAHSVLSVRIECDDPVSGSVPAAPGHLAQCDKGHTMVTTLSAATSGWIPRDRKGSGCRP
jgi:hypothetical protein